MTTHTFRIGGRRNPARVEDLDLDALAARADAEMRGDGRLRGEASRVELVEIVERADGILEVTFSR